MPRSPPPPSTSASGWPNRHDQRSRSRSPGRPLFGARRDGGGGGDPYASGGQRGGPPHGRGGGWDWTPPGGGEGGRRYGDDVRRSDHGGGQGGPSYRSGGGGGGYGARDNRERGGGGGGGGGRGDYPPPALPMGGGRSGPGARRDASRDRGYGPPSSYRRSPSPGGYRRRSPSPLRSTRIPAAAGSRAYNDAPGPPPARGRPPSRSPSRSRSPVKAGKGPLGPGDEAEEGEVVEEGEVRLEQSTSATTGGGRGRRSPSTASRRSDYRRSPSPPPFGRPAGGHGFRGGGQDEPFRRPLSPGLPPRGGSRWPGGGGGGPAGNGRRSPSPPFRRFRSPSPPSGGGGGWRRPREPSPPAPPVGRDQISNAYPPPARRSPPPFPLPAGLRYRSPSPRANEPVQRRRFRSPSPAGRGEDKSVRPGPPRAGAWGGQKPLTSPERQFHPSAPPASLSRTAGPGSTGSQAPPQQGWPDRDRHVAGRCEPADAHRRISGGAEVSAARPVGGDEWAARMKARQEEKDRLRRAGGGESVAATAEGSQQDEAPARVSSPPLPAVIASIEPTRQASLDDRRSSRPAQPTPPARAPLPPPSTLAKPSIAPANDRRYASPDRPQPSSARFKPPSGTAAANAPPVPASRRAPSPDRRRSPSPPPQRRQTSSSNDPWQQQQAPPSVAGSRWKGRPDAADGERSLTDKQATEDVQRGRQDGLSQRQQQQQQQQTVEQWEREREQHAAERERERLEKVVFRLAAGLVRPTTAPGPAAEAVAEDLAADLARTTATLSRLRAEHSKLTWAVWRAEQDVKDGEVERLAVVARRLAAEEGLKP